MKSSSIPFTEIFSAGSEVKKPGTTVNQWLAVVTLLSAAIAALTCWQTEQLSQRHTDTLATQTRFIANLVQTSQLRAAKNLDRQSKPFFNQFDGRVATGHQIDRLGELWIPKLLLDQKSLAKQTDLFEPLKGLSPWEAAVYVRGGTGYVRVLSGSHADWGQSGLGLMLNENTPAFRQLQQGAAYSGPLQSGNRLLLIRMEPLRDQDHRIVGAAVVAVDTQAWLNKVIQAIRLATTTPNAQFTLLRVEPEAQMAKALIYAGKEGLNLWDARDAQGHPYVQEMWLQQQGLTRIHARSLTWAGARISAWPASFVALPQWHWLLIASPDTSADSPAGQEMRTLELLLNAGLLGTLLGLLTLWGRILNGKRTLRKKARAKREQPLPSAALRAQTIDTSAGSYRTTTPLHTTRDFPGRLQRQVELSQQIDHAVIRSTRVRCLGHKMFEDHSYTHQSLFDLQQLCQQGVSAGESSLRRLTLLLASLNEHCPPDIARSVLECCDLICAAVDDLQRTPAQLNDVFEKLQQTRTRCNELENEIVSLDQLMMSISHHSRLALPHEATAAMQTRCES